MGMQIRVAGAGVAVGNAAPISPATATWATPLRPVRVNVAADSSQARVSATAAVCATSIRSATSRGASAHNADTLFTGENVRS